MQLGSDALFARAAVAASLPRAIPKAWGTAIYHAIDRIAPAPFVARELGREALRRGDTASAMAYAVTLPAGGARDALFASIERARGDEGAAIEYELAGLDLPRLLARIGTMERMHPRAAYALAVRLRDRLAITTTHPDALANAYWRCGMLATNAVYHGHRPARWNPRAHRAFLAAARMAPYDNTYALAVAAYYYRTSDNARARRWYRRVVTVNPASADGWSGLGSVALREGDLSGAQRYLATALRYGPTAGSARTLARKLAARERP
uniref:Uncharacterized protein n=1 Tax=mine drainage metagenome TaxID=410659 RepID=E6Q3L1_9ZZZZ